MKPAELQLTALWPEKPASVGGAEWRKESAGWTLDAEGMTARVTGSGYHWSAFIILESPGTFSSAAEARGAALIALRALFAGAASEAASGLAKDF